MRKKQHNAKETTGLNADAREVLKRIHQAPGNSAKFCAKDFTFGYDRFIRALDSLITQGYAESLLYSTDWGSIDILFTFKDKVKDDDTEVEIIKNDKGKRYLKENP